MSTKYIEIDSDIGPIQLKINYEVDYGEPGDYYQPEVHPSVNIWKVELDGELTVPNSIKEQLEEEILEDERNYDPD